jgi:anti-sigma regulatory factor (Ser/Thr protein kinase)
LELKHIARRFRNSGALEAWPEGNKFSNITARQPSLPAWFGQDGHQGAIGVSTLQADELAWTNFVHRLRKGAAQAGFSSDHSAKIAAAIGEIYGNVIDHSQHVDTGYVAYHTQDGQFEFVIADHGIGVLESLRSNPRYAQLADSGTALTHALEQGVSRYTDPDHGFGFVPLFVGLANHSRLIRFRSGDSGRVIIRNKDGSIDARTVQVPHCEGFFCSVLCDLH